MSTSFLAHFEPPGWLSSSPGAPDTLPRFKGPRLQARRWASKRGFERELWGLAKTRTPLALSSGAFPVEQLPFIAFLWIMI
jgi:hypothetical protein